MIILVVFKVYKYFNYYVVIITSYALASHYLQGTNTVKGTVTELKRISLVVCKNSCSDLKLIGFYLRCIDVKEHKFNFTFKVLNWNCCALLYFLVLRLKTCIYKFAIQNTSTSWNQFVYDQASNLVKVISLDDLNVFSEC